MLSNISAKISRWKFRYKKVIIKVTYREKENYEKKKKKIANRFQTSCQKRASISRIESSRGYQVLLEKAGVASLLVAKELIIFVISVKERWNGDFFFFFDEIISFDK